MNQEQKIKQLPKDCKWVKLCDAVRNLIGGVFGKMRQFKVKI